MASNRCFRRNWAIRIAFSFRSCRESLLKDIQPPSHVVVDARRPCDGLGIPDQTAAQIEAALLVAGLVVFPIRGRFVPPHPRLPLRGLVVALMAGLPLRAGAIA